MYLFQQTMSSSSAPLVITATRRRPPRKAESNSLMTSQKCLIGISAFIIVQNSLNIYNLSQNIAKSENEKPKNKEDKELKRDNLRLMYTWLVICAIDILCTIPLLPGITQKKLKARKFRFFTLPFMACQVFLVIFSLVIAIYTEVFRQQQHKKSSHTYYEGEKAFEVIRYSITVFLKQCALNVAYLVAGYYLMSDLKPGRTLTRGKSPQDEDRSLRLDSL